jgi:hypothetical protein
MMLLHMLAGLLHASTLAGLVYWLLVLSRLRAGMRRQLSVRDGTDLPEPPDGWPPLTVIIPAHDEQRVIDQCAATLREQVYPQLEVIFVLDRCTDRTAEILAPHTSADPRIVVIENDRCPADWAGKCNAARLGAERATGDWLLFSDADTLFDPALCRATVALAIQRDAHLLTLLSTLTSNRPHELIAQPVAAFTLMHMFPMQRVKDGRQPRPFANGQFMLFRRDWYERIGGHGAVKDDLLEDMAFARSLDRQGGRSLVLLADGFLRCSMYETLAGFAQGWQRIFMDAASRKPRRLRRHGRRTLLMGAGLPTAQALAIGVGLTLLVAGQAVWGAALVATVVLGALIQLATLTLVYPLMGAPRWAVALFPAGSWIVGRILLRTARDLERRRPVKWGGREYVLEPR